MNCSDSLRSANSSGTDAGFSEDLEMSKLTKSGGSETLSSSTETDVFHGIPSLTKKLVEMDEEESSYVNIQYFFTSN